jgi:hypothetical protein
MPASAPAPGALSVACFFDFWNRRRFRGSSACILSGLISWTAVALLAVAALPVITPLVASIIPSGASAAVILPAAARSLVRFARPPNLARSHIGAGCGSLLNLVGVFLVFKLDEVGYI